MNGFDRILSESHLPFDLRQDNPFDPLGYSDCIVGQPGVRDTLNPCEFFQYGPAEGDCESDGHCMCRECKCVSPSRFSEDS